MARQQLTTVRKTHTNESLLEVDNLGLGTALAEVVAQWATGLQCPTDSHVEKTKVVDADGNIQGFSYYLVTDEPRHLGAMRTEPG